MTSHDCWWRHKYIMGRYNFNARTRPSTSNSFDIDFIHGHIDLPVGRVRMFNLIQLMIMWDLLWYFIHCKMSMRRYRYFHLARRRLIQYSIAGGRQFRVALDQFKFLCPFHVFRQLNLYLLRYSDNLSCLSIIIVTLQTAIIMPHLSDQRYCNILMLVQEILVMYSSLSNTYFARSYSYVCIIY